MNHQQDQTTNCGHVLNLQITIPPAMMKSMIDQLAPILVSQLKAALLVAPKPEGAHRRLAYSPKEAAEILGMSTESIYRLINRGLLRPSIALRRKLISEKELHRFLAETTADF